MPTELDHFILTQVYSLKCILLHMCVPYVFSLQTPFHEFHPFLVFPIPTDTGLMKIHSLISPVRPTRIAVLVSCRYPHAHNNVCSQMEIYTTHCFSINSSATSYVVSQQVFPAQLSSQQFPPIAFTLKVLPANFIAL